MKTRFLLFALFTWAVWTYGRDWWFDEIHAPQVEQEAFGDFDWTDDGEMEQVFRGLAEASDEETLER